MAPSKKTKAALAELANKLYQVKEVNDVRKSVRGPEYRTVWEQDDSVTWEPLSSFARGQSNLALRAFRAKYPEKFREVVRGIPAGLQIRTKSMENTKEDGGPRQSNRAGTSTAMDRAGSPLMFRNNVVKVEPEDTEVLDEVFPIKTIKAEPKDSESWGEPNSESAFEKSKSSFEMNPNHFVKTEPGIKDEVMSGNEEYGIWGCSTPYVIQLFDQDHWIVVFMNAPEEHQSLTGGVPELGSEYLQYLYVLKYIAVWLYNLNGIPFGEVVSNICNMEDSIRFDALKSPLNPSATNAYRNLLFLIGERTDEPVNDSIEVECLFRQFKIYADTFLLDSEMKRLFHDYCDEFLLSIIHRKANGNAPDYLCLNKVAKTLTTMAEQLKIASSKEKESFI